MCALRSCTCKSQTKQVQCRLLRTWSSICIFIRLMFKNNIKPKTIQTKNKLLNLGSNSWFSLPDSYRLTISLSFFVNGKRSEDYQLNTFQKQYIINQKGWVQTLSLNPGQLIFWNKLTFTNVDICSCT